MRNGARDMAEVCVRGFRPEDIPAMADIWNEVVTEGAAFPQEEQLTLRTATEFFKAQSACGVAQRGDALLGLYILHPNNIGRCGHIANASYAVASASRGLHIGEALVRDSMARARALGFRILQFNAVVAGNTAARRLYERIGFQQLGTIPGGFRAENGEYVDICPYYITL